MYTKPKWKRKQIPSIPHHTISACKYLNWQCIHPGLINNVMGNKLNRKTRQGFLMLTYCAKGEEVPEVHPVTNPATVATNRVRDYIILHYIGL